MPLSTSLRKLLLFLFILGSITSGSLRAQSIQTVAGGGTLDGSLATDVGLYGPRGLAFDAAGNLFIAQAEGNQVVRIDRSTGTMRTIAGNGGAGFSGDGFPAVAASLNDPREIVLDAAGNLYIADAGNNRVRRVDAASGIITTIAGGGSPADEIGDGGLATSAALRVPWGLAITDGKLLISEAAYNGHRIRQVVLTPGRPDTGIISTIAGTGVKGFLDNVPATSALIDSPAGITVDGAGNIFFADTGNHRIRRIDAVSRMISTYAGGGSPADGVGDNLPATQAALDLPTTVAFDPAGNLHISGIDGRVRRIDRQSGVISTIISALYLPYGLAFDRDGNLYVTNTDRSRVIKRTPSGEQSIYAGGGEFTGDQRVAVASVLRGPGGIAVDAAGNLFIADTSNARIRKVDATTGRITTVAGNGGVYTENQEGIPAVEARIGYVLDVALDAAGNMYTVDPHNRRIWKINTSGVISTLAGGGNPADGLGDDGPATSAAIRPVGVSVDAAGNVYIADSDNNRIRKVDTSGTIRTIAGSGIGDGSAGYSGDNGPGTAAKLNAPRKAVADSRGNVFISDSGNNVIRKVDPAGVITTYAGRPAGGENLIDNVPALETNMQPGHIALDQAGNLFIADAGFHRIRKVDVQTRIIGTVAGSASFYLDGDYSGDSGPALRAKLNFGYTPGGVAVRSNGDLYISDTVNNRVRAVYACRPVAAPTLLGPENNEANVGTAPQLRWTAVADAFRYDVYLDPAGSPTTLVASDLTTPSYSPANLRPGTAYTWRVTAKGDPFCEPVATGSSATRAFTTASGCRAPLNFSLTGPADGAPVSSTDAVLVWEPAPGASSYDVFLGSATSAPSLLQRDVKTNSFTAGGLARGTTYFWFVVAHASCDPTVTTSTPLRSFMVAGSCSSPGSFDLVSPAAAEANVSVTPVLSWSASANASAYDLYFGTTSNPPLLVSDLTTTSTPVPQLENGTTYFWRVVAKVACDPARNLATAVRSFTTRGDCVTPARPVITFLPATAVLGQSYALSWQGALSLDAEGAYLAERSVSPEFTSIFDSQITSSTTASFVGSSPGTFYHRVRAIPECDPNRAGPNSESASITIRPAPANVVFTVQPSARITALGERLEDKPESFTIENISDATVQVLLGKAEINSVPFFTIVDPAGGDSVFVTLEPKTPKRFEIRFAGPSRDEPKAYEGVIFLATTGTALPVTPYAFVNLKVGAAESAEPSFEVAGRRTEYIFFPGVADDTNRAPITVDIRNAGSTPMDLAGEIGPEVWLQPESGWNNTSIPPNSVRTVRLSTRRSRAPNGSALPRFTYFTVRTRSGKSARLLVQDNDAIAVASGRSAVLDPTAHSYILPEVLTGTSRRGNLEATVVQLSNIGGDPVQTELIFTPTNVDGFDRQLVKRATLVIPPNDLVTLRDPLVQVFGLSSPMSGQFEVRIAPEKYGLVSATSWVAASLPAGGSARYDVATLTRGEGASLVRPIVIGGVRADTQMSADLTLVETTGVESVSVRAVMIDRSGTRSGNLIVEVPRYGRKRIENIATVLGAGSVSGGTIELTVQSGGGSVAGFVLQRSLASDSGTTLFGKGIESSNVNKVLLAMVMSNQVSAVSLASVVPLVVNGQLSSGPAVQYQTSAGFTAPASTAVSFAVSFADASGSRTEKTLAVPAGTTVEFQNILEQFFQLSGNRQGSLFVTHPPGARFHVVLNGAGAGGAVSTVAAVPQIAALSELVTSALGSGQRPLYFDGLEQSIDAGRGSKWSVILNETKGQAGVIRVRMYESGNRTVPIAQKNFSIAARGVVSLETIFAAMDLDSPQRRKDRTNVLCVVTAQSGGASVSAMAVGIDQVSGDAKTYAFKPSGGLPASGVSLATVAEPAPQSRRRAARRP